MSTLNPSGFEFLDERTAEPDPKWMVRTRQFCSACQAMTGHTNRCPFCDQSALGHAKPCPVCHGGVEADAYRQWCAGCGREGQPSLPPMVAFLNDLRAHFERHVAIPVSSEIRP